MRSILSGALVAAALLGAQGAFAVAGGDFQAGAAAIGGEAGRARQRTAACTNANAEAEQIQEYLDMAKEGSVELAAVPKEMAGLTVLLVPGDPAFSGGAPTRAEALKFIAAREQYWASRKEALLRRQAEANTPEKQRAMKAGVDIVDRILADNKQDQAYIATPGYTPAEQQAMLTRKTALLQAIIPDLTAILTIQQQVSIPEACGR